MPFSGMPGGGRLSIAAQLTIAAAVVAGLALLSRQNFLVYHSVAELFAVVIGCSIFLIAWNSRAIAPNNFLLFLGAGYLASGIVDLLHLLAFPGLNVLGEGRGLSSQLWLAARYLEAATLIAAPFFLRRRTSPAVLFAGFGGAVLALLVLIFGGWFPATVVDDRLTTFKSVSELAIAALFAVSIGLLWTRRADVDRSTLRLVIASTALRICSELSLVIYADPHGTANFVGHVLKIGAAFLLYKALVENLLMRPYETLFRNLKEREEQLRAAIEELESFSYSVSHDLRAPLTAVKGYGELLILSLGDTHGDPRLEYANHIVKGTRRMAEIIDDLLRLGQLSRSDTELSTVDVTAICMKVVETLREADPGRNVEVDIEPGLWVRADPRLLRSALENVVGNAWKFTSKVPNPHIEIGVQRSSADKAALYVRDNGAGFDPSGAASIFTPFARLHADAEFSGTGIGLTIVERIVKRHGGTVRAVGEPGKGATFYLELPHLSARSTDPGHS